MGQPPHPRSGYHLIALTALTCPPQPKTDLLETFKTEPAIYRRSRSPVRTGLGREIFQGFPFVARLVYDVFFQTILPSSSPPNPFPFPLEFSPFLSFFAFFAVFRELISRPFLGGKSKESPGTEYEHIFLSTHHFYVA
ncbi:Hypothetical protein NTJ_02383 [Nesidiocoris tenuis]|uniref:Uncharacterized protein n=1 Tax=Nesidiocoris tenuis TaxID=355587 RepID=A0ABN7AB80_9HEMI|nr:Hypothetical protein NTJ_02383 [Nesidiocoris tenuis]